jgi:hypothetical protein
MQRNGRGPFSVRMLESIDLSSAQVDLLNTIAFALSKIPGAITVVLGGSYARRTARPDSDLEVGLYYGCCGQSTIQSKALSKRSPRCNPPIFLFNT